MKRWLAGIGGIISLLIVGYVAYFWIGGIDLAVGLVQGVPLYLGEPPNQTHVSYWLVLLLLIGCPVAFSISAIWLLRIAFCRHADKGYQSDEPNAG